MDLASRAAALAALADDAQDDLALVNHMEKVAQLPFVKSWMIVGPHGRIRWHSNAREEGRVVSEAPEGIRHLSDMVFEAWSPVIRLRQPSGSAVITLTFLPAHQQLQRGLYLGLGGTLLSTLLTGLLMWWAMGWPERRQRRWQEAWLEDALHRQREQFEGRLNDYAKALHTHLKGFLDLFPSERMIVLDARNRIILATPSAHTLWGHDGSLNAHVLEVIQDETLLDLFRRAAASPGCVVEGSWPHGTARVLCLSSPDGAPLSTIIHLI